IEALWVVSDALRLVFASHSLAFCSAAKRVASTGIPSIRIIVESSCKQTREKCLGRLSLARPVRPTTISVAWIVPEAFIPATGLQSNLSGEWGWQLVKPPLRSDGRNGPDRCCVRCPRLPTITAASQQRRRHIQLFPPYLERVISPSTIWV